MQGRFYFGAGGTPGFTCCLPPDSKASWKNVGLYGVHIFFGFGERINGLGDEGTDRAMSLPQEFLG